jgi:hypothetical protein
MLLHPQRFLRDAASATLFGETPRLDAFFASMHSLPGNNSIPAFLRTLSLVTSQFYFLRSTPPFRIVVLPLSL